MIKIIQTTKLCSEVEGYKISIKINGIHIYKHKQKTMVNKILFIPMNNIKYLIINYMRRMQKRYLGNFKILLKDTKHI